MGLLRSILALPVKGPVNGALLIARKVEEAANKELNDPATLRKSLERLERQLLSGEISEEAYDQAETALLLRLRGRP